MHRGKRPAVKRAAPPAGQFSAALFTETPDFFARIEHMPLDLRGSARIVLAFDMTKHVTVLGCGFAQPRVRARLPRVTLDLEMDALDEVDHRFRAAGAI